MDTTSGQNVNNGRSGVEDVMRSLRELVRGVRELAGDATQVAQREVAMAVKISEQIRDSVISAEALKRVRNERVLADFRRDAHKMVDLAVDVSGVALQSVADFIENFTDQSRPALTTGTAANGPRVTVKGK